MMATYYNEYEPYAAEWLRNLIKKGLIPNGEVDTRSIINVSPDDLRGFTQCHFFAGLGGWAYAGRLAGWPDDRPLWTGSAPCQPFSTAGQQKGTADERHLWPVFFGLIRACRPPVVMGEQVAAAVGKDWLDGVSSDLEGIGYACGAVVVPACAVDAPHRRDRLWFVADTSNDRTGRVSGAPAECGWHSVDAGAEGIRQGDGTVVSGGPVSRGEGVVADADNDGRQPGRGDDQAARHGHPAAAAGGADRGDVAHPDGWRQSLSFNDEERTEGMGTQQSAGGGSDVGDADAPQCEGGRVPGGVHAEDHFAECGGRRGHWDTYEWALGSDGKARRVEPSIRLLAHGVPARVGKLRAYGNAIVPQVAAEVIAAYMEAT